MGYQLYLDQKYHPQLVAAQARSMLDARDWAHLELFALEVLRLAAADPETAQVLADALVEMMSAAKRLGPIAAIRTGRAGSPPESEN